MTTKQILPTVLIVEDEPHVLEHLQQQLVPAGFALTIARDGVEAMQILKERSFDLILLDIVMPRMNGFEVMHELQRQQNTIPIIVASSLGHADDIAYALALGAREFFQKSTHFPNIAVHVKSALKKHGKKPSPRVSGM